MDKKKSHPRIVKQYTYIEEKFPVEDLLLPLGMIVYELWLLWRFVEGIQKITIIDFMAILLGIVPVLLLCIVRVVLIKHDRRGNKWFVQQLRNARKADEKYQGEIVSYRIKPEVLTQNKTGTKYVDKITYVLRVQADINSKKVVFDTPELKYCPISVLKSTKCTVYKYNKHYYALDFDLRTKKTDRQASIPGGYV